MYYLVLACRNIVLLLVWYCTLLPNSYTIEQAEYSYSTWYPVDCTSIDSRPYSYTFDEYFSTEQMNGLS